MFVAAGLSGPRLKPVAHQSITQQIYELPIFENVLPQCALIPQTTLLQYPHRGWIMPKDIDADTVELQLGKCEPNNRLDCFRCVAKPPEWSAIQ